jgi:hypothetical protein
MKVTNKDPGKEHFYVSLVKSVVRLVGCVVAIYTGSIIMLYKQSKQNKADRHLESFSDDLRNSIIKKVSSKNMIRPYTPEEEKE